MYYAQALFTKHTAAAAPQAIFIVGILNPLQSSSDETEVCTLLAEKGLLL